mmetsp:Transcript_6333/g.9204  ORF Transcript_6333/g.9204 Transcript_6333/m.9204 type:complete len:340 (+) Transcript_6333:83-1102(+)
METVLGSATAGIISRIFTHPLDTAKAKLQAPVTSPANNTAKPIFRGPVDAIYKTFIREGVRGLYRGFGAVIVGGTPGTILYLCSYEAIKGRLSHGNAAGDDSSHQLKNFGVHFSSGLLAEAVACIIYVPVDVVKERLQVHSLSIRAKDGSNSPKQSAPSPVAYRGSWDALKTIVRTEGIAGIYKGYGATLVSFGPFSALYFLFYEALKERAREIDSNYTDVSVDDASARGTDDGDISFPLLLSCSASAGALASWLTSPLDMAKLRLQIQRGTLTGGSNNQVAYHGMIDCLRQAHKQSGIRGLFRGAGARVLYFTPFTTIVLTCFEKCRSFYAKILSSDD